MTTVVTEVPVQEIQLRDAKAGLSAIVDEAARGGGCIITRHGKREAVVLGYEAWRRLSEIPSFARLLMAAPEGMGELGRRDQTPARDSDF